MNGILGDVLDEIALEGLDGITINTLFERLQHRRNFGLKIDEYSKIIVWEIVQRLELVEFYELSKAREEIVYPSELNDQTLLALSALEIKIYPIKVIATADECGSCEQFGIRRKISDAVRKTGLVDAQKKWGSQLVIVASFSCRLRALWGDQLPGDNLPQDYVSLEFIGRARGRGIATHGRGCVLGADAKTAFYRAKVLRKKGVIKKLSTCVGQRLVLSRFERFCEFNCSDYGHRAMTETIISIAKLNKNGLIPRDEIYRLLPTKEHYKNLRKSEVFQKYFKIVSTLRYRELYPYATEKEYLNKNRLEKRVLCFQLQSVTEEDDEEMVVDDEDEEENDDHIEERDLCLQVSYENQLYRQVLKAGQKGITIKELSNKWFGGKRLIVKKLGFLQRKKLITCYPEAQGRQTTFYYVVRSTKETKDAIERLQNRLQQTENQSDVEELSQPSSIIQDRGEEKETTLITARKTYRISMILNIIKSCRIESFIEIYNKIVQEEKQQKMSGMMDRKTLRRILDQMVKDGLIRAIASNGKSDQYCDLSYDPTNKIEEDLPVDKIIQHILTSSATLLKKLVPKKTMPVDETRKKNRGLSRTTTPKFLRMSILHDIMFYLVRNYTGDTTSSQEELFSSLVETCAEAEDLKDEMPPLYLGQVSCYMFTPPLSPIHKSTPGWCSFYEVIINAPLSAVHAIVSDRIDRKELAMYLDHPVRQHYPIFHLPLHLRQELLSHETLTNMVRDAHRLCFLGLVKLGFKHQKKLPEIALYINQRASIIDTTTSAIGYVEVEKKKDYPVTPYFFSELHHVKRYWIDLFNVCHQTRLGIGRQNSNTMEKGRESEQKDLLETLKAVTHKVAVETDDGTIPGDHLGAGGLHSVMHSFLFANWMNDKKSLKQKKKKEGTRKKQIKTRVRSDRLDELDRQVLMQATRIRVFWSAAEDTILAMCKAAAIILSKHTKLRVKFSDYRAALRRHSGPESWDKTQAAINRRIDNMSRLNRWPSLRLIVPLTSSLPKVEDMLSPLADFTDVKPKTPNAKDAQAKLSKTFQELVDFLVNRYVENGMIVPMQEMDLPDTIEEFRKIYDFSEKSKKLTTKLIKEYSIRAIVLSSLGTAADKTSLSTQLIRVYRQFDVELLKKSVSNLHLQSVIATQKSSETRKKAVVFGNTSYHFSQRFIQLLNTKFPQKVYHNAYAELNRLLCCTNDGQFEMNLANCGPAAFSLFASGHVVLLPVIPEQFVVLNENFFSPDTSSKIMKRYRETVRLLNQQPAAEEDEVPAKRIKLELPFDEPMDADSETDETILDEHIKKLAEAPVGVNTARIALILLRELARPHRKPVDVCVVSTTKVMAKPILGELMKDYGVSDGKFTKNVLSMVQNHANFLQIPVKEELPLANYKKLGRLLEIIRSAGVAGSSRSELRKFAPNAGKLVSELLNAGLVLRTGVDDLRFVSREHAKVWTIKSCKLTRLEKEKIVPQTFLLNSIFSTVHDDPSASKSQTIQVVMRPWIRIDGSVNRRVLDRMLGAFLGYLMCYPGIPISAVYERFGPAFSPVWSRELIDLLEVIGCVKKFTCRHEKPSLFSKSGTELVENLTGLEDDEDILIEPKLDATVKLGQFIGNKSYLKDVLV